MTLRLPYTLVTSMDDVQANFEQIGQDGIGLSSLAATSARAAALKALGIARGVTTLTWAASQWSNNPTVTHGLGAVPTTIVATSMQGFGFVPFPVIDFDSITNTGFNIHGWLGSSETTTAVVGWIAIA